MTASLLIAVLAAAGVAQSGPGRRALGSLGLVASAEPYTELYFASPSALGATQAARAGSGERQTVSFVIHNREQSAVRYEWTIGSSLGAGDTHGAVIVPRGGSSRVTGQLDLACSSRDSGAVAAPVQVRVSLAHPSESIDYWTRCGA